MESISSRKHDELKPLAKTFTDSLSSGKFEEYYVNMLRFLNLVIIGEQHVNLKWVVLAFENLTFDVDARIHLFESNIRVLGGLVSAHILATDSTNRYNGSGYQDRATEKSNKWQCTINIQACAGDWHSMTFSDETQPPDDTQTVVEETQPGKTRSTRVRGRTLGKGVQKKIARKKGEKLHVYVNRVLNAITGGNATPMI
ncbi:Alpha-mannosidase I MNS5 [Camellia lanceoleosa]|uniref:Alpha-mannosidase I MNS5 n=1 Tax=Camellia lanceoleosa TaxID=1840588 RepID=A0ACC0FPV0_9ERIC|nr:Alpha-mannosidase I MNS5 [Camellia lanceoleosa]